MEDNAPGLELLNNQNPKPYEKIYYGNQTIPHPTNNAAKECNRVAIMRSVNEGK